MNRTLPLSAMAATAAGFLLTFTLLATGLMHAATARSASSAGASTDDPVPSSLPGAASAAASVSDPSLAAIESMANAHSTVLEAHIDAKTRAFEARMERSAGSASVGDTVASAMAFAAEISTEVALVSALSALETSSRSATAPIPSDAALDERRRHARRIRGAMAVPYFSFAQGLRGAGS